MHGAGEFLATIEERETHIMDTIIDGSSDPFADPRNFRLSSEKN